MESIHLLPNPTIQSLQADGFKVVICEKCKGWGKIPSTDYGSYEYSEGVCPDCNGTGKQIARTTTSYKPFELPGGSK